jgi:hypothetical protein
MRSILASLALACLAIGCATTPSTLDLLSQAGFKQVPATTEAQKSRLATLPTGRVSQVTRNGNPYFVYPDRDHHRLYVGQKPQYERFQTLQMQQRLLHEEAMMPSAQGKGFQEDWTEVWGGPSDW